MSPEEYLEPTGLLDYREPAIRELIRARGWDALPTADRIRGVYDFVRDDIRFGYNVHDDMKATEVLADGYGQCNTKAILLMALLRAVGVPCRFHGFTIDKRLQKGAITGVWYRLSPDSIVHSWVEAFHEGRWLDLEGCILDVGYLGALQRRFEGSAGPFCGYGVATASLADPPVYWNGGDTYIQKDGITEDLGVYADPDAFFAVHGQRLGPFKRWMYEHVVRRSMNRAVGRIRDGEGGVVKQ